MDLSIIVPAYNEEHRIGPTLIELDDYLAWSKLDYEIVVVDDGSSDGTVPLVAKMAATRPRIRVVGTRPNRGKGHAVRVGMLGATGDVRLMFDADGSMPASEIPKLFNPVAEGDADVAIGSRWAGGVKNTSDQPALRRAWSRFANWFVQRTIAPGVADTQCGFKAFSAPVATSLFSRATVDGWAFDLEVLGIASRLGYQLREVPVVWEDDERSKINPIRDMFGVVREWIAIRRNLRRGTYDLLEAPG